MAKLPDVARLFLMNEAVKAAEAADKTVYPAAWPPPAPAPATPPAAPARPPQAQPAPTAAPRALPLPPGRAGGLVAYLLRTAMYPSAEVAVASCLGLLAGFAGRAYTTPGKQTGLNVYLAVIGRSASGKEAMHEGPSALLHWVRRQVPQASTFVNFHNYQSGPSLAKAMAEGLRSSVTFSSEFGKLLARMANARDTNAQAIGDTLTRTYSKSGPHSVVGDLRYSGKDASVSIEGNVAFSLVGDSTPGTLLAALTADMAQDGFASRLDIVEMPAQRSEYNEAALQEQSVPADLGDALVELAKNALTLLLNGQHQQCAVTPEAWALLEEYRKENERAVNASDDDMVRALHNRAHLKSLKYAGLLAVVEAPAEPLVDRAIATWSIAFARRSAEAMAQRVASGDVGDGDDARMRFVVKLIERFIVEPLPPKADYPTIMQRDGVVPRKYLQVATSKKGAFTTHRLGATAALDLTVKSLVDNGYLVEMDKTKAGAAYTFQGRCFRVVGLPSA